MSFTSDINSLFKPEIDPYTARASIEDGLLDPSSTKLSGDRSGGLFANSEKEMGKDDFLLLLVTQLKYQDPLNPMENTEFVAQLAQFRALESSDNIEKAVSKLDESFQDTILAQQYTAQSVANSSSVSLIGRSVRMRQTEVVWYAQPTATVPLRVHLGDATEANLEIRNRDGEVVKTINVSGKDAQNSVSLQWDGTTDQGTVAMAGTYKLSVEGDDKNPSLYAFVEDIVEGVRFSPNGAMIKIAGGEISIGEVLDVSIGDGAGLGTLTPSTALSLLGKQVRTRVESLRFTGSANEQHTVTLQGQSNQDLTVQIVDSANAVVRTLSLKTDSSGKALLNWGGETTTGHYAEPGEYKIRILGFENDPWVYAFSEGTVDGIANLTGEVKLKVQGRTISLEDILDISGATQGVTV